MKIVNGVKVVIENAAGEVLMLRRSSSDPRRPGQWDFPGGGVERNESHVRAAIRETKEEAGIDIRHLRMLYCATEHYVKGRTSFNRALFHARVSRDPQVVLSHEHDDYKWVSKQQALIDFPHPVYGVGLKYAIDRRLI